MVPLAPPPQRARARARVYQNTETFMTMVYLIGVRLESVLD
jgi:hypothetical protein